MRAILFLLLFVSANALATTIDFEAQTRGNILAPAFTVGEFQVSFVGDVQVDGGNSSWAIAGLSGNELTWNQDAGNIGLARTNGEAFSLDAVDFGSWGPGNDLAVVGYLAAGGTLQFDLVSGAEPSTVNFSQAWAGLASVEFIAVNVPGLLDNIVVNSVPIPAAVWLFGSALAGLGWLRRKQIV
jgi:hypothetical protein